LDYEEWRGQRPLHQAALEPMRMHEACAELAVDGRTRALAERGPNQLL
jgi:hypothetical protein